MKKNEGRRRRRSADNRSPPPRDRVFTATTHFCHHHRFPSPRGTLFSPPGRESFDPERETAARIFTSYPIAPARKKRKKKEKKKECEKRRARRKWSKPVLGEREREISIVRSFSGNDISPAPPYFSLLHRTGGELDFIDRII